MNTTTAAISNHTSRPLILVVEDDLPMRRVLFVALHGQGYDVAEADNGAQALQKIKARAPDAMILDLGLPDMDGVEVAAEVRKEHTLPIIVLSARGDEQQQIKALDTGANDYITKPFREGELLARIRAALRYAVKSPERPEITVGAIRIDPIEREVWVRGVEVRLTPTEFKLVHLLARESDRVVTHRRILREVWGPDQVDQIHYLRVYMKQLRQKLEEDPSQPKLILTSPGVGYRLVSGAEPSEPAN